MFSENVFNVGFTRIRELCDPGAGTLPALRELLPRGGLVRGSVVSAAEFGVLALARWLALRRTGPDAGSPEFPWPGFSTRQSGA